MRGKLMICTKCGGEGQDPLKECDCRKALSKLDIIDSWDCSLTIVSYYSNSD